MKMIRTETYLHERDFFVIQTYANLTKKSISKTLRELIINGVENIIADKVQVLQLLEHAKALKDVLNDDSMIH